MKNKTILILAVAFFAMLAAYYIMEKPETDIYKKSEAQVKPLFGNINADDIAKITIAAKNNNTTLVKSDKGWVVKEENNFPANKDLIDKIVKSIPAMTDEEIASDNPENAALYKVDKDNAVHVQVFNSKDKVIADYYVGKNGTGRTSYVRAEGSDVVTLQKDVFRYQYDKSPKAWRNRSIVKFDAEKVQRIEITRPDAAPDTPLAEAAGGATQTVVIRKNGEGTWEMTEPEFRTGKKAAIQNLVRTFSNLTASDVPPQDAENTGLDEPYITGKVVLEGGTEHEILIGAKKEGTNNYFARSADSDLLYLIAKYQVDIFRKKLDDLGNVPEQKPVTDSESGTGSGEPPVVPDAAPQAQD